MEVEAVTYALRWIVSRGDCQTTHAIILTDSMSLLQKVKSGIWEAHGQHPPSKTPVGVLPWTCRSKGRRPSRQTGGKRNHHKWLASQNIGSVEVLETLPAGTKPRTSHHRSPGREKRRKRKRSMIFLEMTREGHRHSDEHWNRFKGNVGETCQY